jgi:adenosylhomocysteine nucleosidase
MPSIGAAVVLERCNTDGRCVEDAPEVILGGNGVSGPTMVDHAAYRDYVWQTFHADALDMETAAWAHVAYTHNIPFLAVRAISDLAGGEHGKIEYSNFLGVAAVNAAIVTEAFVRAWASR